MQYDNPLEYKGFTISASALQASSGKWKGVYIIQKDGKDAHRAANAASHDSEHEAIQHTIALARGVVDGHVPGLKL